MKIRPALLLALLVALILAVPASADPQEPRLPAGTESPELLAKVASTFAMRPVFIRCETRPAWNSNPNAQGSWGYTFLFGDAAYLAPLACEGALHEADLTWPAWTRALGALVLTHESYHMRHWPWRAYEARVECQAIRHFRVAVQLLGGSAEEATNLLPYALSIHWRVAAKVPVYNLTSCRVPNYWH